MPEATTGLLRAIIVFAAVMAVAPAAAAPTVSSGRIPLPQRQIRTSASSAVQPWHPTRVGAHVLYGTIAFVRGALLTIQLRNGTLRSVDATAAIANGDYSAPLFVGKLVSIDGDLRGTVFTAAHISRMTDLTNLGADR
jgi:hypothetical protein